jgi:ribonuclease P/MRP protein subunit RPP1
MARKLGWDMLCLVVQPDQLSNLNKFRNGLDWRSKPRLAIGVEISSDEQSQIRKLVSGVRKSTEIVVVRGGTPDLNRMILETPEIDILINHDVQGKPGVNHVLAKLAKKNNVAIALDFNQLMVSYRLGRIQEFSAMQETAKLIRKFQAPFILTSGARDPWDMRSPSDLLAFGKQLGFSEAHSRKGLSDSIVRENKKRLSGKWVMPGVEVE